MGRPLVTLVPSTTTITGAWFGVPTEDYVYRNFQVVETGTGAITATTILEVSNDGSNAITLATVSSSGTTTAIDGFVSPANWPYVRARVTAISGTGAAVVVTMGV